MATIKEITTKCKAGEIEEAYEIALQDWQNSPDDVWTQREVGWALYYLIKNDVENKQKEAFYEHLDKLGELSLLDLTGDSMIYENVLWKLAEFVKNIHVEDFATVSEFFVKIQGYTFLPSRPYSLLLQNSIKFEGWNQLADFIDWWNLDNLLPEDYEQFKLENGRKIMSLAERAFIAYSKALLKLGDQARIAAFLPKIEALMDAHPEMLYPGYFCGKLLIAQGAGKEEALRKVVPFVRKKSNEFWAWQLMSDIFRDEPDKQLACLLRAVHCQTQESFLGKIRIRLAENYIQRQDYPRAKYNIDKVSACYLQQGWKLPGQLQQWSWQNWLQTVQPDSSDPIDYTSITNALLFTELEECVGVVSYVDKKAKKVALVFGIKKRVMSEYVTWKRKPKEGDLLRLHYSRDGGRITIVNAEVVEESMSLSFLKQVTGTVVKQENNPFAFLKCGSEKCFVSPVFVSKYNLKRNDMASALVVYDYNKKKDDWGWSVISITNVTPVI